MTGIQSINMRKVARAISGGLYAGAAGLTTAAVLLNPLFAIGAIPIGIGALSDVYLRWGQKKHTIHRNFGLFGTARKLLESVGPELHQYWIEGDLDGRPFRKRDRSTVYAMAKGQPDTVAFGTLDELVGQAMIAHSMLPLEVSQLERYSITFGEGRCKQPYTMDRPLMVAAMSFGALGERAVHALSYGAKKAGIILNTGEGGYPKHHLKYGADLIFQLGTAKFGCRANDDGLLDPEKLKQIVARDEVKMVEIKFSQGAKPGKGGYLPAKKVTSEIAELRGVPVNQSVKSPAGHTECNSLADWVRLIGTVQETVPVPVGMKLCLGKKDEFVQLIDHMIDQNIFPDYIAIDGAEGGTGAAPQAFMDHVGTPLFPALEYIVSTLTQKGVRDKTKIIASGKLIEPEAQFMALAYGADAVYTARGFLFALGCIQALECNSGNCPSGITTHKKSLQHGLHVKEKGERVARYVESDMKILYQLLGAVGKKRFSELDKSDIIMPTHVKYSLPLAE